MLSYRTAGESHGPALIALVEGLPSNIRLDFEFINNELKRRQGGYRRLCPQRTLLQVGPRLPPPFAQARTDPRGHCCTSVLVLSPGGGDRPERTLRRSALAFRGFPHRARTDPRPQLQLLHARAA